jgi:hypothetical protein
MVKDEKQDGRQTITELDYCLLHREQQPLNAPERTTISGWCEPYVTQILMFYEKYKRNRSNHRPDFRLFATHTLQRVREF